MGSILVLQKIQDYVSQSSVHLKAPNHVQSNQV